MTVISNETHPFDPVLHFSLNAKWHTGKLGKLKQNTHIYLIEFFNSFIKILRTYIVGPEYGYIIIINRDFLLSDKQKEKRKHKNIKSLKDIIYT